MDRVYYKSSTKMEEINDNSIDLIVTSPPYFNIKDYSKDGYQLEQHSASLVNDLGVCSTFSAYIDKLLNICIQSCIQNSILNNTKLYLLDLYIWNRTNSSKKVMYTTNAIESLNSVLRRLNSQRSVFPSDTALLKALYLATFEATKKWTMPLRNRGKVYGELSIMYDGWLF